MGNCTHNKNQVQSRKSYEQCPQDLNQFDMNEPHKKEFQGHLSNIKIENLSDSLSNEVFSIHFGIQDILHFECELAAPEEGKIKWKNEKHFIFEQNDYELRVKFLRISVCNNDGKKLTELKINLFRIITGPFHHDFSIGQKNKIGGRLIFDIKISQIVELKIDVIKFEAIMSKEFPGDKFNFIIEPNGQLHYKEKGKIKNQRTHPSYSFIVPLEKNEQFRPVSQLDEEPSPTLRLKRRASLIKIESPTTLRWSNKISEQMPTVKIKIKASELLSCSFNLKIFRFVDERRFTEFSQFSFSFSEVLPLNKTNHTIGTEEYGTTLMKNIYINGKIIGNCSLELSIKHNKFLNQIMNQSQTEDGIVNMTHIEFYKLEANYQEKESIALENLLKRILEFKEQLTLSNDLAENSKVNLSIKKELDNMYELLMKHMRNSYAYQNEKSKKMKERKTLLLRILNLLCKLIEDVNEIEINDTCWKNVVCILKRGELQLKYWEFTDEEIKMLEGGLGKVELKEKLEISFGYLKILYHLLKIALNTEMIETSSNEERQNSEIFKANCFFRIPQFRKQFLKSIEESIQENRNILIKYEMSESEYLYESFSEFIPKEVDWENKFFKPLEKTEQGREMEREVCGVIENHEWFQVMVSEPYFYCNFIRYIVSKYIYLKETLKFTRISYFPGYSKLVRGFLLNLCMAGMPQFDNFYIITSMTLLDNDKLAAPIFKILFKKTNLYDQSSLVMLLHILSHLMHSMTKNGQSLLNFPYTYMMKGLKLILEAESSICLSSALIFIYNNYDYFEPSFRYELSLYLLGKMFWRYFYNWSFNIRRTFHHIITLKISQDSEVLSTTDISDRLTECFKAVSNGEMHYFNLKMKRKAKAFSEKILYKNMKNKMKLKMQRNNEISKSGNSQGSIPTHLTCSQLIKFQPEYEIFITNFKEKTSVKQSYENDGQSFNRNTHMRSSDSNDLSPLKNLKMKKKFSFYDYKFVYHCFNELDCTYAFILVSLCEINYPIEEYLENGAKEFKEIIKLVEEHYRKFECLPVVDLGNKIEIDEKEMLPSEFDRINFE